MSISEKTAAAPKMDTLLIENRFALRRKMSSTALADVYWADDLYMPTQGEKDHLVLLVLVASAIVNLPGFAKAWSEVMSRPAPPAAAYPNIIDWGNDNTHYWFSCSNTQGSLLSEYFNELDKRSLTADQALNITEAVSHALSNVQAGAFGYFEPGATLQADSNYVLINAPLAKVMHLLLRQQTGVRAPLALHSSWLSPSVAVGDLPVTEDDSFSMASLYQMLLGQQLPYGQESTLTALAHGTSATIYSKLKPEAQQLLGQALSLQRNQRPENPEALLKALKRKNYRKLVLPLAVLAAVGVVVYASYHLISKFNGLLNEPTPITQTISTDSIPTPTSTPDTAIVVDKATPTPPTAEAPSLVNEASKAAEPLTTQTPTETATTAATTPTSNTAPTSLSAETPKTETELATSTPENTNTAPPATSTESTAETETSAPPADLTPLILKATNAFNADPNTGTEETLSILRQVWAIDRQNPNARALLNQVIAQQQQKTENHINLTRITEAKQSLAQTDDLIREFNLTDRIEEQVRLENQIEIRERETREANEIIQQTKAALKRGDLAKEDGANNATAHLNKLMFMLPNHSEGRELLNELVQMRQAQIKRNLERNRLARAGSALDETSRLIRKYNLTSQTKTQASLEQDYRQAIQANQAQATTEPNLTEENTTLSIQEETPEPNELLIPAPVEGERYVTPVDDLNALNQPQLQSVEPVIIEPEPQPVIIEGAPAYNPEPVNQAIPRPQALRPAPIRQAPAVRPVQPMVAPTVDPQTQQLAEPIQAPATVLVPAESLEELPTATELEAPVIPAVEAGIINNQGILDAQIITRPPTEEDIPDSERK